MKDMNPEAVKERANESAFTFLLSGGEFAIPGETIIARMESSYCVQRGSDCRTCSMVNYGRDCRNNIIPERDY